MSVSGAPVRLYILLACAWALALQAGTALAMETEIHSTHFVTTDGVRLHVLEACPPGVTARDAASPVIALVPGWLMPADVWRKQLLVLGEKYCVAALDPRGQGESDVAADGYTIGRRAMDIREFVTRYPRVVLVGWSLGALEALEYIDRYGHAALAGLVLVDSSVGEDPEPPSGSGFRDSLENDRPKAIADFMQGILGPTRDESEIAAMTTTALRMPLEDSLSLFPSALPRTHWRDITRGFPKPLLYIVSTQFAAQAKNLQENRPATDIAVFSDAGHALFADEPDKFNALLARFVRETGGTPASR